MTQTGVFAFQEKADETLEDKVLRICETIVSCGISVQFGQIRTDGNMVAVENAIRSISKNEMRSLFSTGPYVDSRVHNCMYNVLSEYSDYLAKGFKEGRPPYLNIALNLANMKELSTWDIKVKPVSYDVNAAGAKMVSYVEPKNWIVKKFVDAFDIGYKSPSTPQPKTPTGAK